MRMGIVVTLLAGQDDSCRGHASFSKDTLNTIIHFRFKLCNVSY